MQKTRYYLAYGSNLHLEQMKHRCPFAKIIGTADIKDYELLFKGSLTGSYLTIEPKAGASVPVAVWAVTPYDERALDRYEGYPSFYYKKELEVEVKGIKTGQVNTRTAFVYIMHEERKLGIPSGYYMRVCEEGYTTFGFDKSILWKAYKKSEEECK